MTKKNKINTAARELRNFGLTFAALCVAASVLAVYKGSDFWFWFLVAAILFLAGGTFANKALRPVYIGWMKFASFLGWINTNLLLGVFFYIILTPTGILMRLFGKDLLDVRIKREAPTYWKKRTESADPRRMERQF